MHQADSQLYVWPDDALMSDLVICKLIKSMVIHDTKYSHRDQVSLNYKTKP